MITANLYTSLAALLRSGTGGGNAFYVAVGTGSASWDRNPPLILRDAVSLVNEVARKTVAEQDICFVDESGADTETPSARVRFSVRLDPAKAVGTLRELGLFAGAGVEMNSGTLLSYIVHPPIEKTAEMGLERTIRLDLRPRRTGGVEPTRFLGNSHSREVHDLENLKTACQVGEIRFDRRIFFASVEQAVELGYDRCAFCFGRARSER